MINFKKKVHINLLNIFKKNILNDYRVIVKFKINLKNIIKKFEKSILCTIIHEIEEQNILCLIVTHKILNNLIESPEVEYICLDSEVFLCANRIPAEIETSSSKIISNNSNLTGKDICIGLIDSGIYPKDSFIKSKNRILLFEDLLQNFKYPYDDNGHGSAMCTIMGDKLLYKNQILKNATDCNFAVIKAFDKFNKSYCSTILNGLNILYKNISKLNIQVICLPFEIQEFNEFILDIFQNIFNNFSKHKVIIIVPVGNNSNEYCSIKGLSLTNNTLCIGGNTDFFSSKGINKRILKPNIISIFDNIFIQNINTKYVPLRNNQYIYPPKIKNTFSEYFGTSCSCAYIASLITLLKQKNTNIDLYDILSLLKISCYKNNTTDSTIQGLGLVDLNLLLE